MRNKEKQMICMACNCLIIKPEEFDPSKHFLKSSEKAPELEKSDAKSPVPPERSEENIPPNPLETAELLKEVSEKPIGSPSEKEIETNLHETERKKYQISEEDAEKEFQPLKSSSVQNELPPFQFAPRSTLPQSQVQPESREFQFHPHPEPQLPSYASSTLPQMRFERGYQEMGFGTVQGSLIPPQQQFQAQHQSQPQEMGFGRVQGSLLPPQQPFQPQHQPQPQEMGFGGVQGSLLPQQQPFQSQPQEMGFGVGPHPFGSARSDYQSIEVKKRTLATLYSKLESTQQQLAFSSNLEHSQHLCSLLDHLLQVIERLEKNLNSW